MVFRLGKGRGVGKPVQSFQILLFPNLEVHFQRAAVVFDAGEPGEVRFRFVPFSGHDELFEVFDVEVEAGFPF